MNRSNDRIDWTDVLFIPGALISSYLLERWLRRPLAVSLSVILFALIFYFFQPRKGGALRILLAVIIGGIIAYSLTAFLRWMP